jgi:hypothetical protein
MDIDQLSYDQLVDLNHRIVQRLQFLDHAREHAAMLEFRIGERVVFDSRGRGTLYGIITKYNKKTVNIVTDGGERWRVHPTDLRSAERQGTRMETGVRLLKQK